MWQKIWGKQMNQIVERVEHITSNGKYFLKLHILVKLIIIKITSWRGSERGTKRKLLQQFNCPRRNSAASKSSRSSR